MNKQDLLIGYKIACNSEKLKAPVALKAYLRECLLTVFPPENTMVGIEGNKKKRGGGKKGGMNEVSKNFLTFKNSGSGIISTESCLPGCSITAFSGASLCH